MLFSLFRKIPLCNATPFPAPIGFPYIVRDNKTGTILAHGSKAKCQNYVNSFGQCHVTTCNGGA